jgi:ABC-type dipeptide/oligopeptide/nickel transport system ATPase component
VVAEDINFVIERGETQALVGESGSGKSVTAFHSEAAAYPAAVTRRAHLFRGEDLMTRRRSACARSAAARSP